MSGNLTEEASYETRVSHLSEPSALRITDLRIANLVGVPFRSTIVRIDTNQGISGYGEVRDQASSTYVLSLKSRLIGENPCNIDKIFRKIKQFGGHGRQGGGVSAIEMALMDLAGKAYGVPAYALAGGKFRDEIMCYADTPDHEDPKQLAKNLLGRRELGYKMLKVDVGIDLLWDVPGALIAPPYAREAKLTPHPFTGLQVTTTGIDYLVSFMKTIRDEIGYDIPLAVDHFGHIPLDSCIRIARAFEPFNLAWVEDMIPWQYTEQWRQLTLSTTTPTCTGEDIYLAENFRPLIEAGAIRVIHPDPATLGGILETKRLGDYAYEYGIPMALHLAASPIATMACVHAAAASENFIGLEHHAADVPFWSELVTGLPQPLIQDGFIQVPDAPGLGFGDINEDLFRDHLDQRDPVFFAETTRWDDEASMDRVWG
jgi:L-alanine-DL-glutamate epimerase-like enolase superfamily enzyme